MKKENLRPVNKIAEEILRNWPNNFPQEPKVIAAQLAQIADSREHVGYFLGTTLIDDFIASASQWTGPDGTRLKNELKQWLRVK